MGKFTAQIDAFVSKSNARMLAVARASIQEVADRASKPKAKGGNMPVDTGFLRASGQFSFNGMPTGPMRPGAGASYPGNNGPNLPDATILELSKLRIGQTIFWGWTAGYAPFQENKNGFLRLAVQQWQAIVNEKSAELKQRIK